MPLALMAASDEPVLELIPPPPPSQQAMASVSPAAAAAPISSSAAAGPAAPGADSIAKSPAAAAVATSPAASAAGLSPVAAVAATKDAVTMPGFLTAIAGNRSVLLSWYPSEGSKAVSGYLIYRGEGPSALGHAPINRQMVSDSNYSDNDSASDSGPLNRHPYFYRVRAYDVEGRLSPYSDLVSATPNGPLLPPGRVEGLAGDGKVRLTWTPPLSTGEGDLARLWVLRGATSDKMEPLTTVAATDTAWEDAGLVNGKAQFYALLSEDDAGRRSPDSPQVRAVPFRAVGPPRNLSSLGVGEAVVRLKWDPPAPGGTFTLKGYNVYRSSGAKVDLGKPPINKALIPEGTTRWEDDADVSVEAPKLGQLYTYAMVAVDSEDEPSAACDPSSAGPVPSITNISPGEIPVFGESNTLQIQGRKTINLSDTWVNTGNSANQAATGVAGGFQLDQQLQVRLTGKVGRKIKVDVDYDDKALANQQQKISVVYTGDNQEVFKEFAFGDIQMDMGAGRTEFAPYNKSLFGAKLKLESPDGKLRLTAIGAQTKGFTETKRFVGGYEQVKTGNDVGRTIPDTSFTPYKFYYLNRSDVDFVSGNGNKHIVPNSVIIDYDLPGTTNYNPQKIAVTGGLGDNLNLVRLTQGLDYLVDSATGLVTFLDTSANRPQATTNLVVAYKYVVGGGTSQIAVGYNGAGTDIDLTSANLISDSNGGSTSNSSHMIQYGSRNGASKYDGHMSCQFYNLGDRDILDPASDPDFKMAIYGPNQSLIYQLAGNPSSNNVVAFDTHGGWMRFTVAYPFAKTVSGPGDLEANPPNYANEIVPLNPSQADAYNAPARVSNFNIHIEYKHKLTNYSLRFSIIHGSETITLNNKRLTRDQDYFLDYDSGILVFSNPGLVGPTDTVEATYEYMPFGGQYTSTVWGARAEYDLTKDLSVGSSFLWNSADTPQDTPDIKSAPYSLQLLDGDVLFKLPQDLLDKLTRAVPGLGKSRGVLKVTAKGEMAHSWYNPNTYSRNNENGVAMVDNFESVDGIVGVSLLNTTWYPSSQPLRYLGDSGPAFSDRRFGETSEPSQYNAHDSVVRLAQNEAGTKAQLEFDYQHMDNSNRWDSYVQSFGPQPNQSIAASDTLELWYNSDHAVTLHVDVGEVSEDAVATGQLATESTTGIISTDQDTGILYSAQQGSPYPLPPVFGGPPGFYFVAPPSGNSAGGPNNGYWGKGNNALDTEDFDGNGALSTYNHYYSFTIPLEPTTDPQHLTQVLRPLTKPDYVITNGDGVNLSTVLGSSDYYTRVRRVRLWYDQCQNPNGSIRIETLQFTGNRWQVRADPNVLNFAGLSVTADTAKFSVAGVNGNVAPTNGVPNSASPVDYVPDLNFFNTGSSTNTQLNEQSLQLTYRLTAWDNSPDGRPYYQARRLIGNGTNVDMGGYKKLRVDVYKPNDTLPGERLLLRLATDDLNYFEYVIPLDNYIKGTWNAVTLALDGTDGQRTQMGFPYLRQVNYCSLAVAAGPNNYQLQTTDYASSADFKNAEVLWLDNLRVTDSITRDGGAAKADFTYDLFNGGITVTHDIRSVDSDFIMMDQQGNAPARHKVSQVLDGKINMIPKVPITLHYEDNQNFVDAAHAADPLYSRNFLDPDQSDQKASGALAISQVPFLPGLTVNGSGSIQHIRQIFLPDAIRQLQDVQGETITPNTSMENDHVGGDATMKFPKPVWGLAGDELRMEVDYDANSIVLDNPSSNPGNLAYRDQDKTTLSYKGRYSGSYHFGKWLSLTPSYAYSLVEASGTLPQPTVYQGTPYYYLDSYGHSDNEPQSRAINPSLVVQFGDLGPLRAPKATYNFTQTRDYIRNELRSPGSLDLSTSLNPAGAADLFKGWPAIDLTQSWQVDSVVNDDLRFRGTQRTADLQAWLTDNPGFGQRYDETNIPMLPDIALAEQGQNWWKMWWVRIDKWDMSEDIRDPLNIENIAVSSSRRSVSNASTRFDYELVKGWPASWAPHVSLTDARTMSAPEQVTRNQQFGAGLTVDLREPHIPFWQTLRPSNLNLGYDFSNANNYVEQITADPTLDESLTSNRISHTLHVTLPTRPNDQTTLTVTVNWTLATDTNYTPSTTGGQGPSTGGDLNQMWEPDIKLVYFLNVDHVFKMPDFWPFYGRELKVKQAFRLDNDLDIQLKTGTQTLTNSNLPQSGSNTYILRDQLSYNVLDNVKLNFGLEQHLYQNQYASSAINQAGSYYSFKLSLGLEATF